MVDRRQFLIGTASLSLAALLPHQLFSQEQKRTRIILLGTKGGPRVGESGRSNPATLILVNDVPYVVDCGYGTSRQLLTAGVPLNKLRHIFITHLHSDHSLELGPLIYNAWITGIPIRVDAYGPSGLRRMTQDAQAGRRPRFQPTRAGDAERRCEGQQLSGAPSAHQTCLCLPLRRKGSLSGHFR